MQPAFRRIALIGKQTPQIAASLKTLRDFLRDRGCEVIVELETARSVGDGDAGADFERIGREADLAIVVGGDGTMLSAARNLVRFGVPLAGINQGRVGFMTDIAFSDIQDSVGAILAGRYAMESRSLLDAEIRRGDAVLLHTLALNEAVVGKGSQGRLIEFELRIDGEYVYRLRADGVIVTTPTGSTAYSLSAQGPILQPTVPAFALVPLNPHVLSARPVSVSDASLIEIGLLRAIDARAHFDGFALADMQEGDRLVLKRSVDAIRFVHPPGYSYFMMLREKMRWSENPAPPLPDD
ncbi:MAG: NAD kinase [Betaproteobacteria bacterium RIFCSPLOWO2_02_FULL_66_14]|nr:MAG: NAD kinase [Betaproteobacteria bacterium RIFCSPLOWO2_02_FULL_66_14]